MSAAKLREFSHTLQQSQLIIRTPDDEIRWIFRRFADELFIDLKGLQIDETVRSSSVVTRSRAAPYDSGLPLRTLSRLRTGRDLQSRRG